MSTDIQLSSDFQEDIGLRTELNSRGDLNRVIGEAQTVQRMVLRCFEQTRPFRGETFTAELRVEMVNDLETAIEDDDELPDDVDVEVVERSENGIILTVTTNVGSAQLEVPGTVVE